MKFIMSFWSKPYEHKVNKRWHMDESVYLSWIYSVQNITKFYKKPILYTDRAGRELLCDKLHIKFENVHEVFDDIPNNLLNYYWIGKYWAAAMIAKPFVHFDYDFFLREKIPDSVLQSEIFFERKYEKSIFDRAANLQTSNIDLIDLPDSKEILSQSNFLYGTGVFGGQNSDYYKFYNLLCLQRLEKQINLQNLFNKEYEYVLHNYILGKNKIVPKYLTDEKNSSECKYTHVFLEKENKTLYGKIQYRILQNNNQSKDLANTSLAQIKLTLPTVSLIIIPNKFGDCYKTIVKSIIPKQIAFEKICLSMYNLDESIYENVKNIQKLSFVKQKNDYLDSLQNCLEKISSDVVVILDENVEIQFNCIFAALSAWLMDYNAIYCATVRNQKNKYFYAFANTEDYVLFPQIADKQTSEIKQVKFVSGGFYLLHRNLLQSLLKNKVDCDSFADVVQNYSVKQYCVTDAIVNYIKNYKEYLP